MYKVDGVEIALNSGSNQNLLDWKAIFPYASKDTRNVCGLFQSLIKHA